MISLIYFVLIIDVSYYKQFISEVPQSYTSKGSILRSGMSFVVALLFFLNMNQMKKYQDYQLYFYVSIICVLLFPLSFFLPIPATRIGVYFGFIQFIILPRYVDLLRGNKRSAIILFIFLMYLFVFIMWLVYSPQKELWYLIILVFNENIFFQIQLGLFTILEEILSKNLFAKVMKFIL